MLATAIAIGCYVRASAGMEWEVESARELIEEMGLWAPGLFVLLVAFRLVILVPSQAMLIAGGVCFGFPWGAIYGAVGVTLSGLMAYGLARYLGGDVFRERVPSTLQRAMDVASRRTGAVLVTVGTAYPVGPLTGYHIAAGLACMSLSLFFAALALGALMRASLFTFLGSRVAALSLGESWPALLILVVFVLPLLHPSVRNWAGNRLRDSGDVGSA